MSDNVTSADNQQGSRSARGGIDPSETTRRAPYSEKEIKEYWRMYVLVKSRERFAKIINSWHPRKIVIFRKRMKI